MISEKERNIIAVTELKAESNLSKLAKKCSCQPQQLRYYVNRLVERDVIYKRPLLNLTALGFDEYIVCFSLMSEQKELRKKVLDHLKKSERVKWLLETIGDFQFTMAVLERSPSEISEFFNDLSNRFGNIFFHKEIAAVVALSRYNRRFLSTEKYKPEVINIGHAPKTTHTSFDELDHNLLIGFTENHNDSLRTIAKDNNIPVTTLTYRLNRMKKSGLLKGFVYEFNQLSQDVHWCQILVYAKGFSVDFNKKLFDFANDEKNVVGCFRTMGSWDYQLHIEYEDNWDISALMRRIYDQLGPGINKLKCEHVIATLKRPCYPVKDYEIVSLKRPPYRSSEA